MRVRKSATTRKTEIVDTALRLADTVGPDRLTTNTIAEAIGLTQPGIFRHFPRKGDIWNAVAERIGALMVKRWEAANRDVADPVERIRATIGAQLRLIKTTPAIPAILFSRELHTKNKGLRTAFFALLKRFHHQIEVAVRDAQAAGRFRPGMAADDAAFLIVGLVQGLAVRWSLSGRSFDLAAEGLRLLDLQLSGFAAAPAAAGDHP
jgi:AcrR family transcriptional regulator